MGIEILILAGSVLLSAFNITDAIRNPNETEKLVLKDGTVLMIDEDDRAWIYDAEGNTIRFRGHLDLEDRPSRKVVDITEEEAMQDAE